MSELISSLTDEEIRSIADTTYKKYSEGYLEILRGITDKWTWVESSYLRNSIVIPVAVSCVKWALTSEVNPEPIKVRSRAYDLSMKCDLSALNDYRIPAYNINGIRESLIFPTTEDSTISAIGISDTREAL